MHTRREFLKTSLATAAAAPIASTIAATALAGDETAQRITLAQVEVTRDVAQNLHKARQVFQQAEADNAGWVMFPEMFLSGYYGDFDQKTVAGAFSEIRSLCRQAKVIGLIGTGWKRGGQVFNQIRVVGRDGNDVSQYAKTCLCYGEAEWTAPGETPLTHQAGGLKFGLLICNDLWVTPGFSDGPNPHLALQQARAGAQVIFHAINSGSDQRYRLYHESNHLARAAGAKCPIVAVNAFVAPEVNASSGVIGTDFRHLVTLPRDRETVLTAEFTPARRNAE